MNEKPWDIAIKKHGDRWVVEKPRGNPNRGKDSVRWTLKAAAGEDVSAHIQLAHMNLFMNLAERNDLSRDMTATIPAAGESVTLRVHPEASNEMAANPHYYAVFILDKRNPERSMYAVGEDLNPPPEINVGP